MCVCVCVCVYKFGFSLKNINVAMPMTKTYFDFVKTLPVMPMIIRKLLISINKQRSVINVFQ